MAKKNDFDQEQYVQKVDSAHTQIKGLSERVEKIETLTDGGLILKTFQADARLRKEIAGLIWETLVGKAWIVFFSLLGAVILIPLLYAVFKVVAYHVFGLQLT